MRVVYMGTPEAAVHPLQAIIEAGHEVVAVVSQPDRPKGRGRLSVPTPVKAAAIAKGVPVIQPEKVSDAAFLRQMRAISPDVAVVMAFGQKIPSDVLDVPRYGFINIHASLLPQYRGAAPVQRAIMDGRESTGVTVMYMSEGMDEGDMGLSGKIEILPCDDSGSVLQKASAVGAELAVEMLRLIEAGKAPRIPQDHAKATFAKKLTRKDETIDWGKSPQEVVNVVRALSPMPGATTMVGGNEVKVLTASIVSPAEAISAGLPEPEKGLAFATSDCAVYASAAGGWVKLGEIRPAGGKTMDCKAYSRGRRILGRVSLDCPTNEVK